MVPTLKPGDIVFALEGGPISVGDLIAFDRAGEILIRRVVAGPGDVVEIDPEGIVSVNGSVLDEGYLPEDSRSYAPCTVVFPLRVPDGEYFVLADQRISSVDSRNGEFGCIGSAQVIGRLALRIWPLTSLGFAG